jgi:hypothetical protein
MPENNPYQKQILDEYIEKLITELSIGNYPPEDQEAMLEDVHNRFEELILSTTLLMLDSEQRTEFEKALDLPEDSSNPTEVIVFKKKTPTLLPQNLDKK